MSSTSLRLGSLRYRDLFLAGLLCASFLPLIVSVLNFEVLDRSAIAILYAFGIFSVLGTTHVWITVAYYFDKRWTAHFKEQKYFFYVTPAAIMLASIAIAVQPKVIAWEVFGYGIILLNLWHHSKQNWGIMAMVGKLRGIDVQDLRLALVWAWPFFLFAAFLRLPAFTAFFEKETLVISARVSASIYLGIAAVQLVRSRLWRTRDPVALAFALGLSLWFVPTSFLFEKPYYLTVWVAAHALQYYLFVMVSLSMRDAASAPRPKIQAAATKVLLMLFSITIAAYLAGSLADKTTVPDHPGIRLLVGIIAGINLAHFWLDALIWRFSDAKVRSLHGSAYSF